MLKMNAQAFSLNDIVDSLSTEYDVSKDAIYKDWRIRKEWMTPLLNLGDLEQLTIDLYAVHKEIYKMTVLEFFKADNSNAKVGALRLMRNLNHDFIGMFPKVINTHLQEKRTATDINAILEKYRNVIYEMANEGKTPIYIVSYDLGDKTPDITEIDLTRYPKKQHKKIQEVAALLKEQRDIDIEKDVEEQRARHH